MYFIDFAWYKVHVWLSVVGLNILERLRSWNKICPAKETPFPYSLMSFHCKIDKTISNNIVRCGSLLRCQTHLAAAAKLKCNLRSVMEEKMGSTRGFPMRYFYSTKNKTPSLYSVCFSFVTLCRHTYFY